MKRMLISKRFFNNVVSGTIHKPSVPLGVRPTFSISGNLGDLKKKEVGDFAEVQHVFTQHDVDVFADLCGDSNPLHTNPIFAKGTIFGGTIVHGIFVSSLFSKLFGSTMHGAIYVNQTLNFKKPVHVGAQVTARVEIKNIQNHPRGDIFTCSSICIVNSSKLVAVEGEAKVLLPKLPVQ